MGVREKLNSQKIAGLSAAAVLLLLAGVILLQQFKPKKQANLDQAYYTDDDGKTWFTDSTYRVAPFDHNGKTAVLAHIYTYDNGSKQFCAYLSEYTPEAKRTLDNAISAATAAGKPPESIGQWGDRGLMGSVLVKLPGAGNPWLTMTDPKSVTVCTVHSPDGSAYDQLFVY